MPNLGLGGLGSMINPRNEGALRVLARAWVWLTLLGVASMPACGSSSKATGAEGGACFSNGTCNAGLSCLSHLCVNTSPSDAAAGEGGGAGHGAGGGAAGAVAGSAGAGGTPSSTAGANGAAGATAGAGAAGATAGSGGATGGAGGAAGDHGDASVGDAGADAGLALPAVSPSHLQVWLTADRACGAPRTR